MDIQGAIFDLDGTLLDSMGIWETVGRDYLRSLGKCARPDFRNRTRDLCLFQVAEYMISEYDVAFSVDEIMEGVDRLLLTFYHYKALAKPGVAETLAHLKVRGVKMCVATATDRHLVEGALKRNGLLTYFEHVFTCTEVGYGKDSPEIFNRSLKELGTDKHSTYVFEDALYAIETAKAADYKVIAVYDKSAEKHQTRIRELADIYVKSFDELVL